MGTRKKEKNNDRGGQKISDEARGMNNVTKVKGVNFYRNHKQVQLLNMRRGGKAVRDRNGNIIKAAEFQTRLKPGTMARVQPDRRWFGNTRSIGQEQLTAFRDAMSEKVSDPYTVLLKQRKIPMSLLKTNSDESNVIYSGDDVNNDEANKLNSLNVLSVDSFENTFGPKAQRKRPTLSSETMESLASRALEMDDSYTPKKDTNLVQIKLEQQQQQDEDAARDPFLRAGQSRRIWNELYKVIDSSDILVHVLDARDPNGTRCRSIEKYLRDEAPHKHLIFVLNKCDLVPTWVATKWVKKLSEDYPTLAFHANIKNSFGKGSLIQLLTQFSKLHMDKKQVSVGFVGYPNTGKSSIINTLRNKKVCTVAPIPGETKVWQYITLMKRVYLIDCPGVVAPAVTDSDADIVLRGTVRTENLTLPETYIPEVIKRVRYEHLLKTYGLESFDGSSDFLEQVARKHGKLLKGGDANEPAAAKMVLNDFSRGKIPHYMVPDDYVEKPQE